MFFTTNACRVVGFAVLAATTLLTQALAAQTDPEPEPPQEVLTVDDEIVVSAGLTERRKDQVGSSVTILDRQEIERRNKTTVLELLRTVPGIEVSQSGGAGKTTSVFIRGGNSNHTLVEVDGVRVNDNTTGGFDFADLAADNLERIEVLRGPQGVLYGSEAVAGVVSIVTRRGSGPARAWVSGSLGDDDYSKATAGLSGGNQRLHYSLSASRVTTDGVSAASESAGNSEQDPWRNLTLSGRLGGTLLGDGTFDVAVRHTEGDTDVDGFTFGVGPTDDLNAEQEREMSTAIVTLRKPITERWSQTLEIAGSQDAITGIDPDDFFSNFKIRSDTSLLRTQADLVLSEQGTLSIGYQVERRESENEGSFEQSLYLRSFYAENLWTWGETASLSLGLRNDDHSIFGDETSYRLAASVRLAPAARLHGSLGTGFRAPSFNELYFPGFGNPGLDPETSEGFDLGVEWRAAEGRVTVDLTYFDAEFDDLILFTFPAGFVNVAEAESSGIELLFDWQVGEHVQLRASHTYNETEDLATGGPLARRPEHRSTVDLFFEPLDRLRASASLIAVRDRVDSDGAIMDDYERVDLSVDYRLNERLLPFLRIENLFDQDYAEIPGYTAAGFTFAAGLRFSF